MSLQAKLAALATRIGVEVKATRVASILASSGGGLNLIKDPTFSSGLDVWTKTGAVTLFMSGGRTSGKMVSLSTTSELLSSPVFVRPGETYALSLTYKSAALNGPAGLRLQSSANGTTWTDVGAMGGWLNSNAIVTGTAWADLTGSYTVQYGVSFLRLRAAASLTSGSIQIDSASMRDVTGETVGGDAPIIKDKESGRLQWAPPVNLIDNIEYPFFVAHRNGPLRFPEESMEGQEAIAALGRYGLEVDVGPLSDGTLVACHDSTVDRTMNDIGTGAVNTKTPDQWRQARIKPVVDGGKSGTPIFFEEWLDKFGGGHVLVPELKASGATVTTDFINAILDRGLTDSVIAQTFNYADAVQMAAAGLKVTSLCTATHAQTPATIAAAGIWGVSPSSAMTQADITLMKNAGLKVISWVSNDPVSTDAQLAKGVDGVFSDDPEYSSRQIRPRTMDSFPSGYLGPGYKESGYPTRPSLSKSRLFLPLPTSGVLGTVNLGEFGTVDIPFRISMDLDLTSDGGASSGLSYGFYIWNNTVNPDTDWQDAAVPGQNGFTTVVRRSGAMACWSYTNGSTATAGPSTPAQSGINQFAESGKSGSCSFVFEVNRTTWSVSSPSHGYSASASHSFSFKNLKVGLRNANNTSFYAKNIKVERL